MKFFLGFCCSFVTVLLLVVTASCSRMTEADPNEMIKEERPVPDAVATLVLDVNQLQVGANGGAANTACEERQLSRALQVDRQRARQMGAPRNLRNPGIRHRLFAPIPPAADHPNEMTEEELPVPYDISTRAPDVNQPHAGANIGATNAVSEEHRWSLDLKANRRLSRQAQLPRVTRNSRAKRRLVYQVDTEMVDAETE